MNAFFEQSRSHWVRYDRYEIKTVKDGKKHIIPAKDEDRTYITRSRKRRRSYWTL